MVAPQVGQWHRSIGRKSIGNGTFWAAADEKPKFGMGDYIGDATQ